MAAVAFTALLGGCGGSSVSSSPAQATRDLFAAIQANNCDQAFALQSKALDTEEGGKTKACAEFAQLSVRYHANTFRVDHVERTGNRATVLATRTNPDGSTKTATLGTVIEDGAWKVDSLASTSPTTAPAASTTSSSTH